MRIVAEALACIRGGREVFRDLSFTVNAGEMLAVTGPNGAGKSSLLRVLAGLLRQTDGRLVLHGGDAELTIGEQAHYVGHQDALKPSLTVQENLAFWSGFLGGDGAVGSSLARVGLKALAHLPARYLSAGQRRRLSLARLLAVERPLWLLDEPASTLDTAGQALLSEMMAAHLSKPGLILAAVHGPAPPSAKVLRLTGVSASGRVGSDLPQEARL
ncbi:MAG TPA: heme ABC exporter ATP-binding protein CcmA [Xanthobacteraceae bacterium]|jgi:heme exporter protein A